MATQLIHLGNSLLYKNTKMILSDTAAMLMFVNTYANSKRISQDRKHLIMSDIAPHYEKTSSQKRSGMAHTVKGSPMHLSTNGTNHASLSFSAKAGPHLPTPEG